VPSVSIRLRNSDATEDFRIADIALRMSGLLVTLARSSTSYTDRVSHETAIPTEIQHEAYLVEKLKRLFLSINESGEWLINSQPSESQLDKPSWWLREFPESFLHSSLAHQSECSLPPLNPNDPDGDLEFDGIQALRNACLFAIERNIWSDRFTLATQVESRRQVYNLAYGLSHEINNPLANIAARAEQLISRVSNAADRKSLATIVDQAMRAHEMLAEMMLAVQPPTMNFIVHDLKDIVRKAIASFAAKAESAQVGLESQFADCNLKYSCDASGLSEAIAAAIRNALEAARPGDLVQVILEVTQPSEQSGPREIRLAVVDNGPGMSPNALQRVWDLYYSGREAGRGLGLGLAKLRRNIEAHHGRVWINSVSGGGTSVEMRLPLTS
jgi:signal transduction histidine kinase